VYRTVKLVNNSSYEELLRSAGDVAWRPSSAFARLLLATSEPAAGWHPAGSPSPSLARRCNPAEPCKAPTRLVDLEMAGGFGSASKTKTKERTKGKKNKPLAPPATISLKKTAAAASPVDGAPVPHELPEGSQFMGGWRIDPAICDGLVRVFDSKPEEQLRGQISMEGGAQPVVNKDVKDSVEMSFAPNDPSPEWRAYQAALNGVMGEYIKRYPMAGAYGKFGLVSRTNFQYYPPSGGYKTFHTERTGAGEPEGSRHLVFMTYLNDVTDAGGTEFYHQNLTVQPVKGLTLIWPADWTFTHRGVPSPTQEKRIMTGWLNYFSGM